MSRFWLSIAVLLACLVVSKSLTAIQPFDSTIRHGFREKHENIGPSLNDALPRAGQMVNVRDGKRGADHQSIKNEAIVTVRGGNKKSDQSGTKNGKRSLAKRRILSEYRELKSLGLLMDVPFNASTCECGIRLMPLKKNLLEWHFSMTGVEGSSYEGGVYHGRILLHPDYPRKAPSIRLYTPNGRWNINQDICLSASAYHPEAWIPTWNLRTLVLSLRGFMLTQPREIGAISTTPERQKQLALASRHFVCKTCGVCHSDLLDDNKQDIEKSNDTIMKKKSKKKDNHHTATATDTTKTKVVIPKQIQDETVVDALDYDARVRNAYANRYKQVSAVRRILRSLITILFAFLFSQQLIRGNAINFSFTFSI